MVINMKVKIEKLDYYGRGITHIDGKVCFVPNTLENEQVEIEIVENKKKYMIGKVTNYLKTCDKRIKPKCKYYDICGGCNLGHISFEDENKFKVKIVNELFNHNCKYDVNIKDIIHHEEFNYRNKIVLHSDGERLGLYNDNSHDLVEIDKCLLVSDRINDTIPKLDKTINQIIRVSNDEKELSINDNLMTSIGDRKYYLSKDSFFQINKSLTEKLYNCIRDYCNEINPLKVLDLFCGIGSIGIYIDNDKYEITGVDYSKSNIHDAKKNSKLNNCKNTNFICDRVENVIDQFNDYDLVIIDPPRAGLHKKVVDNLIRINSRYIIYVSCNPHTLIRDLNILYDYYGLKDIKLFNMFPRTYHCESVCILERR